MAWFILLLAGLCEVGWAVGLKYTQGFTRPWPSIWTIALIGLSLWLLSLSLRTLPLGTAYAVWTGVGTVGTAIVGMTMLGEPVQVLRLLCIGLILAGIVGLKLLSST